MEKLDIPNQAAIWDKKHANGDHLYFREEAGSPFAQEVETFLPPNSLIVDLGTGDGGDALYFAQEGHEVVAADFSKVVIGQDKKAIDEKDINFMVSDIRQGLPFRSGSVDAVFAHLSLHYYDDETTKAVFKDIARILRSGGILAFACKSTSDPEYEQGIQEGTKIEEDFFIFPTGHARHFFTPLYADEVMQGLFTVGKMEEVTENYSDKSASFIRYITRKAVQDL